MHQMAYSLLVMMCCVAAVASFQSFFLKSQSGQPRTSIKVTELRQSSTLINDLWSEHFKKSKNNIRYQLIAAPGMEQMAQSIALLQPDRFLYHHTSWDKFPDGTDNIDIGGFRPLNYIAGEHVLFLASFHNNDVTLSQFSVMITLLQSFINSLTVVLPFYPVGTMERIILEGQVATANTYAQMFSSLPSCGKPTRLIIYDLHTLQNRFYLHNHAIASLQTAIPVLLDHIRHTSIDTIAFPDDGAAKRFGDMFKSKETNHNQGFPIKHYDIITCGKTRTANQRTVTIQQGSAQGKHILIVDDLVQTGNTLYECANVLKAQGAESVSVFVSHAVFPNECWRNFTRQGNQAKAFDTFYVTNSIPTVTDKLPRDDVFEVLELQSKIIEDLDRYS